MKNNEKKSYHRVQKDKRDFDALFNAEIDIEARERRRQRTQKRKEHKSGTLIGALIKASKISVPQNAREKETGGEDPLTAHSLLFHVEAASEIAGVNPKTIKKAKAAASAPGPERLPEASKASTEAHNKVFAAPHKGKEAETGSKGPKAVNLQPEPRKDPEAVNLQKEPIFKRAAHFIQHIHAELTDKELIAKLREEPEDSYDMFAEIKESLENSSIDTIAIQTPPNTGIQEPRFSAGQEAGYIAPEPEGSHDLLAAHDLPVAHDLSAAYDPAAAHDLPVARESGAEEEPAGQEAKQKEDDLSLAVDKIFSEVRPDELGRTGEAAPAAMIPEMAEAMKEIDYERIMHFLDPKFAGAVNGIDYFLDTFSQKIKTHIWHALARAHILPGHSFQIQKDKPAVFRQAEIKAQNTFAWMRHKALQPAAQAAQKSVFAAGRRCKEGAAFLAAPLRRLLADKKISLPAPLRTAFAVWPGGERGIGVVSACSVLMVSAFFAAAVYMHSLSAFEVYFMESSIGIVKEKNDVLALLPKIEEDLEKETGVDVAIDEEADFVFETVSGKNLAILGEAEILDKLNDMSKLNVSAYGLVIDDENVAILSKREECESVLESIKNEHLEGQDASSFQSVGFSEDIRIIPVQAKMMQVGSVDEVKQLLIQGTTEEKIHTVCQGETLSGIAKSYGIGTNDIIKANPNVNPTKLQINQEISLIAPKPFVTVQTKEVQTYVANIPFAIQYEETQSMFKGETTVKTSGQAGQKEVVAEIIKKNGVEVSRTELASTTLKEPVNQVVIKGAKPLPLLLGTGSFSNPVRGKLSSRYGQRWSRQHEGVDISAPKGTTIKASDGGTVTYAGYDGAYGNTVRVDHGGNKTTVYAHMSKISVKEGQKISKGQQVGTVGTTGRATGPHLHFEVRVRGEAVNPLQYVNY